MDGRGVSIRTDVVIGMSDQGSINISVRSVLINIISICCVHYLHQSNKIIIKCIEKRSIVWT